jgi:hypothetical protein
VNPTGLGGGGGTSNSNTVGGGGGLLSGVSPTNTGGGRGISGGTPMMMPMMSNAGGIQQQAAGSGQQRVGNMGGNTAAGGVATGFGAARTGPMGQGPQFDPFSSISGGLGQPPQSGLGMNVGRGGTNQFNNQQQQSKMNNQNRKY